MPNIKELSDDDLEKVNGGYTKNEDGSVTFWNGEVFKNPCILTRTYTIKGNQTISENDFKKDKVIVIATDPDGSEEKCLSADFLINNLIK